jgi:hypothetical protein
MILKRFVIAVCLTLFFAGNLFAQDKKKQVFAGIPLSLRSQLVKRIDLFTEYQRSQDWDNVRTMLTDFYMSSDVWKKTLTTDEIENILTGIKQRPVIKFTPKATFISTAHYSRPLNQRDWIIWGCAEYLKDGVVVHAPVGLRANLKRRQWMFGNFIFWKMTDRYSCDGAEETKARQN